MAEQCSNEHKPGMVLEGGLNHGRVISCGGGKLELLEGMWDGYRGEWTQRYAESPQLQ